MVKWTVRLTILASTLERFIASTQYLLCLRMFLALSFAAVVAIR